MKEASLDELKTGESLAPPVPPRNKSDSSSNHDDTSSASLVELNVETNESLDHYLEKLDSLDAEKQLSKGKQKVLPLLIVPALMPALYVGLTIFAESCLCSSERRGSIGITMPCSIIMLCTMSGVAILT